MPLEWANWQATVYHGLPSNLLSPDSGRGDYLAFIGRISVEKRVDRAIEIARRAGMKIKIAAKIDAADQEYFRSIEHLLDDPLVECIGEVDDLGKQDLLGGAYALLFPIDWPEPFGLVIIEAMACGTPVIAFRCGSVPELIEDGVTGFIVDDIDEAVAALAKTKDIDRRRCREVFEERFSAPRMTRDYLKLYARMIEERPRPRRITDSIAMMGG
jgi:glycosyltransferase involved in cell wall biosynthesis